MITPFGFLLRNVITKHTYNQMIFTSHISVKLLKISIRRWLIRRIIRKLGWVKNQEHEVSNFDWINDRGRREGCHLCTCPDNLLH